MKSQDLSVYGPGDVVFGADPNKGDEAERPWIIISNHDGQPFHGDQYIALTLTTKSWLRSHAMHVNSFPTPPGEFTAGEKWKCCRYQIP